MELAARNLSLAATPDIAPPNTAVADADAVVAALYARHARRVFNLALRFAADAGGAEDLTQEVFLRILTKLHTLQPDRDPGPWVTRVAVSVFLNHRPRRPAPQPLEIEPAARSDAGDPHDLEAIRRALGRLTRRRRVLFLLVHHDAMTAREAAEVTGIKLNTVKSDLKRARATLRRILGRRPADDRP